MTDILIVFLPLMGALAAGFLSPLAGAGRSRDRFAQWVTCAPLAVACALSWVVLWDTGLNGAARTVMLLPWVAVGDFAFDWALRVDTLTAVMMVVVTTVSAVVHVYSVGYMAHDRSIPRFMAYLSLFTFAMLMLVTADNLVQMFFGWEGVGVASYLLIGFWHHKPSANAAAIKAFLVNRVGDIGFALGIFAVFILAGSVALDDIFAAAPAMAARTLSVFGWEVGALTAACLLLFIGAMGKSAQLGLHTWLPDAMEGPTPVSALIHAATMVTAGVFMVCRLSPLFEQSDIALAVVTVVGASTAFFAATISLTQTDIKRVIAYSTCSQLGYMFFAAGVSAYQAAMFHLMTHAFFKALLFLGAGSVIHAMSDEQDMRRMGGLWRMIPVTYAMMWIGSLALMGVGIPGLFGLSGFYSKDLILEAAWGAHTTMGTVAFWLGVAAAFMTAFYSARLLFLTFHGRPRCDEKTLARVHESPAIMTGPLWILVAGAVLAGAVAYPLFVGDGQAWFWNGSIAVLEGRDPLEAAHHAPLWVKLLPLAMAAGGLALAWWMYLARPGMADRLARRLSALHALSLNKWYFDELYDRAFVRPAIALGRVLSQRGDRGLIDRLGPDGVAARTRDGARLASVLQSGYVYHYAFAMLIGVVALITWRLLFGGGA